MASRNVRALVKPDILVWARQTARFSLDEVASTSGLSKVREWESGDLQPTINQLRALAKKYRRPLAVFYLQERPQGFQVISDFRRQPGEGMQHMSPELHLQVRAAQERREIALDLLHEVGEEPPELTISASIQDDPEEVGMRMRRYLGITDAEQRSWRDARKAFNSWRERVEDVGVLVFQMDKINPKDASGFALSEKSLPVIAVNRGDVFSRRTFSLLHEFAHLLLAESGVSETAIDVTRSPETQRVEVWCNAVAAATAFPKAMFVSDDVIQSHDVELKTWSDEEISALANSFSMSKVATVRRLLTLQLTTRNFYKSKETHYAEEYSEFLKNKKVISGGKKNEFKGRSMTNEAFSLLGKSYIRMVLVPYQSDRITLRDVSAHLNLKTKHIPKVERRMLSEVIR